MKPDEKTVKLFENDRFATENGAVIEEVEEHYAQCSLKLGSRHRLFFCLFLLLPSLFLFFCSFLLLFFLLSEFCFFLSFFLCAMRIFAVC